MANGKELTVQEPEVTPEVDTRTLNIHEDNLTLLEHEETGDLFVETGESELFELTISGALLATEQSRSHLEVLEPADRNDENVNTDTTGQQQMEEVVMD